MAKYYYMDTSGTRQGPMTLEELVATGHVTSSTPVWREGMQDWDEAFNVREVAAALFDGGLHSESSYARAEKAEQLPPPIDRIRPNSTLLLILSIGATVLCCPLLGIPAIVYAARIDNLWYERRYAEAERSAKQATTWIWVSAITGVVGSLIYVGLIAAGVLAGSGFSGL